VIIYLNKKKKYRINMYSKKELDKIEEAIKFASREIEKNCRNQKPLLLHSVIVATKLMELKASYEAVVAGALHDLVEDTNCTLEDIEKRFGSKVAELIEANTHQDLNEELKVRWQKSADKLIKAGQEAMMIKLVDSWNNLPYYKQIVDKQKLKEVAWKHRFLVKTFKPYLKNNQLFKNYQKMVEEIEA
jgi:(p)ppGpp synthase/HD superfamily hydrolase